jgi:hypothetical protein
MAPPQRYVTNLLPFVFETFEKWLRRTSKIFLFVYPLFGHNSSSLNFTGLRDSVRQYSFVIIQDLIGIFK